MEQLQLFIILSVSALLYYIVLQPKPNIIKDINEVNFEDEAFQTWIRQI